MDYQRIYNSLIDNKSNLILLTAREHYLAHWLLHRINPTNSALSHAFWMMNFRNNNTDRVNNISSRMYAESKEAMAAANRVLNVGKKVKQEHLKAWYRNKNNSKKVINSMTGEVSINAKSIWLRDYSSAITYSAFMLYIKHPDRFKGVDKNRKLKDLSVLNWRYDNVS